MTLNILMADRAAALKAKNTILKTVLSDIIGAINKAAIDRKTKDNITEDLVNEILLKEKKIAEDMVANCPISRSELLDEYMERLDIINYYAPKLISDKGEIMAIIDGIAAETAIDMSNKGLVMKTIMPRLKGRVDMKVANEVLRNIFS